MEPRIRRRWIELRRPLFDSEERPDWASLRLPQWRGNFIVATTEELEQAKTVAKRIHAIERGTPPNLCFSLEFRA